MNKKIIKMLFSDMCCSACKSDFNADCLFELRKEDNLSVLQVVCSNCGKSFGIAFLGTCDEKQYAGKSQDDIALHIQDGPDAICYDDVIDAHNFFKNLDENWQQHIPEDLKKNL